MPDNVVPVCDTRSPLSEIALLFLKLGTTAFGGPAAHIAMMDEEVVRRRHWLSEQEFLDYLSAVNFIPGPNSTEMAIHIGHRRGRLARPVRGGHLLHRSGGAPGRHPGVGVRAVGRPAAGCRACCTESSRW